MKKIRMYDLGLLLLIKVLLVAFAPRSTEGLAVMSIDLGTEFMKIGIVKPGIPMEIVLNKESRRKTPLVVSVKSNEREFGEMALSRAIKSPKSTYFYLTQILGKSLDSAAVKAYKERYPFHDIRQNPDTKTIYFQHDENTTYTPEELLAMILDYARDLAADFGEQSIDAAVIAVPPYFTQAERKAVLRAADIANLKVLQLINTNVAAALNYGVFRRKDFNSTGTTLMLFDMGGTGIIASVVTFQLIKQKDDYEANPQLTVRGVGFDRAIGGQAFTERLAHHLAKKFYEQHQKDVYKNAKAILKLYKEAERVKNILSANVDTMAQIEGLVDELDLKQKVTREEFESLCADLFDAVKSVVERAVRSAETSLDEIQQVVLFGASTRIPRVQTELLKATKKSELGKNLNTDEAAALGAVYQAAYQSKGYKVKTFHIKDVNMYPLCVDFERHAPAEGEQQQANDKTNGVIRRVLFDKLNIYPSRKVMTFSRHTTDFGFIINYGDLSDDQAIVTRMGLLNISQVHLSGVTDVYEKHRGEETKGLKVHFRMDDSGILRLDRVDITFENENKTEQTEESTLSKLGNKLSSFFGSAKADEANNGEENKSNEEEANQSEEKKTNEQESSTKTTTKTPAKQEAQNNSTNQTVNNAEAVKNQTTATKLVREVIKFEQVDLDLIELSDSKLDDFRTKLSSLKEREREIRKRAAALNALETFIFDTKDKLQQQEFIKCSTESEREQIGQKLNEADAWMSDADDSVETKQFSDKLSELKTAVKSVFFRVKEKNLRPKRLDELKDVLNRSVDFLNNSKNLTGTDLPLTETEWSSLQKLIDSTKEWRTKLLNEQAKLADHDDPILLSNDIQDKIDALKREINYLISKIKYFRPKTTTTTTKKPATRQSSANETATEENSNQSEKQEEESSKQNEESNYYFEEKSSDDADAQKETTERQEDSTTTNNPEL